MTEIWLLPAGVGKTSLVTRYEAKSFHRNTSSTIGASFSNFELIYGDTRIKMQVHYSQPFYILCSD